MISIIVKSEMNILTYGNVKDPLKWVSKVVTLTYVDGITTYFAGVNTLEKACIDKFGFGNCFEQEFASFYNILTGGAQEQTYDEFMAPVFILNAIERSMNSGRLEIVNRG